MKIFCLCLPENPKRIEQAKKHFEEMAVGPVEFFWGVNAPLAGLATDHVYEVDNPGSGFRVGARITGCWLGHTALWNHMMHLKDDVFMVLEDDALFQEGWKEKFKLAMSELPPDFDFFHIGSCCTTGHPNKHIHGDVYECKNMQCTHAYLIARKCLPFVCRTVRKCWAPIDIQLVLEVFPHLRTFAHLPRLVDQRDTVLPP